MTIPNYLVRIKGKDFDCLGMQLVEILDFIKADLGNPVWYACDVDTNAGYISKKGLEDISPLRIGSSEDLIFLSKGVDQFYSGVFLALEKDVGKILTVQYSTEDLEFRDLGLAFLEIRAFDSSYFEIYTLDYTLIRKIARQFYGIVQHNPTFKKDVDYTL